MRESDLSREGERFSEKENLWHNEALQLLDCLVCGTVEGPAGNDPPASPTPGQAYLVGSSPTAEWAQYPDHIAAFGEGGWRYIAPVAGLTLLDRSTGTLAAYHSDGWETGTVRAFRLVIDGQQVVGSQADAIADPSGGVTIDAQARSAIVEMLAALRQHGLISQ